METGKSPLVPGESEYMEAAFRHANDFTRPADKAVYWDHVALDARGLGFEQAHDAAAELATNLRRIAAEGAALNKRLDDIEDRVNRKVITGGCALPAILIILTTAIVVFGR